MEELSPAGRCGCAFRRSSTRPVFLAGGAGINGFGRNSVKAFAMAGGSRSADSGGSPPPALRVAALLNRALFVSPVCPYFVDEFQEVNYGC